MASRCRPFTPAPYTPNIRLIWWYTPCFSTTRTVRPSGERAVTSAGDRAVPSASVTPRGKAGAHLLGEGGVQRDGIGLGDMALRGKDIMGKSAVIGQQHKAGAGLVQTARREQLPPGVGIPTRSTTVVSRLSVDALTTPSGLLSMR